jgi:uncharacterized protein YabE (DUF348 family)
VSADFEPGDESADRSAPAPAVTPAPGAPPGQRDRTLQRLHALTGSFALPAALSAALSAALQRPRALWRRGRAALARRLAPPLAALAALQLALQLALRPAVAPLLLLAGGALLISGYLSTQTPVLLSLDGDNRLLGTHQTTVAAVLRDQGIALQPEDVVQPDPATLVTPGLQIEVRRASHVTIQVDGRVLETRTHEPAPLTILADLGVRVGPADEVVVDGQALGQAAGSSSLLAALALLPAPGATPAPPAPPELIAVRRAVEITVDDGGTLLVVRTTQPTVGQALYKAGIILFLGDSVQPPLWTRVSAGLHIEIRRSFPVTIQVDGHTVRTRTFRGSVGEVLADTGVALVGEDYSLPTPDSAISPDLTIQVVRVREEILTEQETIPYETVWQGDPTLEIDHQRINQAGELGVRQRRTRVRYENGLEVNRVLEDEWVLKEPVTHINAYGTQIVIRTLETAEGTLEYWRVIPMLATSYSASTAGTPHTSPYYGKTRIGWPMRHGLVAVDPTVIPLLSQVYVPGYGVGIAADTGSAIKNRRIDLGYDDDNLVLWYSWTNVYLLTPVPDPSRIQYRLWNWPAGP